MVLKVEKVSIALKLIIICQMLFYSAASIAFERVVWVTESWQNYTQRDGLGLYHELMAQIFNGHDLNVVYMPWLRSLEQVKSSSADFTGAMPINNDFLFSETAILSQPVSILIKKDRFDYQNAASLKKQTGTWRHGYKKELLTLPLVSFVAGVDATDQSSAINLLMRERVDYYIDVRLMLEQALIDLKHKEQYTIIDVDALQLHMAFTKSDRGMAIKKHFDQQLEKLALSGALHSLYKKYGVAVPK